MKATLILTILISAVFTTCTVAQSDVQYTNANVTAAPASPSPTSEDESAAVQPASSAVKHTGPISFRRSGLWLSTKDGSTHLQVHGYLQADDRMFSANTHGEQLDTFLFRKIRPLFEGTLFNAVDFRFMPDFGQYNPQIQEAFLELKTLPYTKLRVGKFKEPIGLEVLRQDRDLSYEERSLASDLLPLRYIGAQLSGSLFSNLIDYAAGYFNGSSDGSNGVFTRWAHGNEAAARVFLQPFATTGFGALKQFGFGLGGSAGSQHGSMAGLKTMAQTTFFKYSSNIVADGHHNRVSPQAYYYAGPIGVLGEYVISSQQVLNNGLTGRIRNEAWQVAGSVMLTGEKNSYGTIRPRNSFEPNRGFRHLGAVELALRYSQLSIDGDAFAGFAKSTTAAQQAKEVGIGLNWSLNQYVKLATDYEHTSFRMATNTVTPLHDENVLISRLQLAF
ncbi:MAG TPA: porin [Candidatus Sulfotelmatobacter sp.]|nr:porin [Candidatus Sulfotelmatobacter sp.]